jgi:ribonuclease R
LRKKKNKPYKISKNKKMQLKAKLLGVKKAYDKQNEKKNKREKSANRREKIDSKQEKTFIGEFTAHPRGFGFVTVEGFDDDFFIPETHVNGALHKDTVRIVELKESKGKRREARIESILSHNVEKVVGTFTKMNGFGFVIPDDKRFVDDLYIPSDAFLGAANNDKVVCIYTKFGDGVKKPEGRIVEIIGGKDEPGADILSIVKGLDIPSEFPIGCLEEADHVNKPVKKKQIKSPTTNPSKIFIRLAPELSSMLLKDFSDITTVSFPSMKDTVSFFFFLLPVF